MTPLIPPLLLLLELPQQIVGFGFLDIPVCQPTFRSLNISLTLALQILVQSCDDSDDESQAMSLVRRVQDPSDVVVRQEEGEASHAKHMAKQVPILTPFVAFRHTPSRQHGGLLLAEE